MPNEENGASLCPLHFRGSSLLYYSVVKLNVTDQALGTHCPEIHHSDQGVQYAALEYTNILHNCGVRISMAEVGEPTQNGYAERLMRTIKEEEVDLSDYQDYHHAYQQIGQFLEDVYMRKRVHSSLNYLTPAEFESQRPSASKVDSNLPVSCPVLWAHYIGQA